jgi:hypothetical protein
MRNQNTTTLREFTELLASRRGAYTIAASANKLIHDPSSIEVHRTLFQQKGYETSVRKIALAMCLVGIKDAPASN